jgi:steroid 5-alpha reductase family enzyme
VRRALARLKPRLDLGYLLRVTPALQTALVAAAVLAAACWILSLLTRDVSWVDRIWSLAPVGYVAWFASRARFADARLDLMLLLVVAWGLRLTYNFARKGGYRRGGEDYRWPVLRRRLGPLKFQLFNATFIAPFQNALLLGFTLPAWAALERPAALAASDVAAALLFVALLIGETIADQQQWRFQEDKAQRSATGRELAQPFLTSGLFRYSRHPNFFCEMGIWWSFYLFSVAGSGWLNASMGGVVVLTLLFQGSTRMTEAVSQGRYPSYGEYQRTTSRLIPWFPRR